MRYHKKPKPKVGDKKTVRRFLLLPMCDYNGEVRWLTWSTLVYECKEVVHPTKFFYSITNKRWVFVGFQDLLKRGVEDENRRTLE